MLKNFIKKKKEDIVLIEFGYPKKEGFDLVELRLKLESSSSICTTWFAVGQRCLILAVSPCLVVVVGLGFGKMLVVPYTIKNNCFAVE